MTKKILIIDDSALMRRVISDIINSSNDYEVAAIAKDGVEGFDLIVSNPSLYSAVILDINMPKMNGLELLEKLQKNRIEQTVIVVSTVAKEGARETIRALELGAFDFVTKPENYLETKGEAFKKRIHEMLDIATAQKPKTAVFSSAAHSVRTHAEAQEAPKRVEAAHFGGIKTGRKKLVALCCSTGGPKSLQQVIPMLPANLDAPVVLVQHMPAGFTLSLANRLNEMSMVEVKEAQDGDILKKATVYIAPGGKHTRVVKKGSDYCISLSEEPAVDGLRPCANVMYKSLETCDYDEITCVVLTGMGADGTKGIKGLSDCRKRLHVISQDENTCVVYGMPKAIAQTGLVDEVVPLGHVAEAITKNVGVS